jgi:apoptosis-inducing factor 2
MNIATQRPSVVVIGGGYGGVTVAKVLDDHAHVILVEPKDAFVHNVAALRALVEPRWLPRIFLPYDQLLARGAVLRDRAAHVDAHQIVLASGQRLSPDVIVLATGSTYPFPAKSDETNTVDASDRYRAAHANLEHADRVLLLGAGAVGLELAGEIAAAWPDKHIVLVDRADQILPGPYDQRLRDELNRQLDELGVERVMGNALAQLPDTPPGEGRTFTVATTAGTRIEADIWFRCHGIAPVTDYLGEEFMAALTHHGYLKVTPQLQVVGFDRVYALGDIAAIDINKASVAARQAQVVAANIQAQLAGTAERTTYTPAPPVIILPLGPTGGAGQLPNQDDIATAEFVSQVKGRDMMIERYAELLNAQTAAANALGLQAARHDSQGARVIGQR